MPETTGTSMLHLDIDDVNDVLGELEFYSAQSSDSKTAILALLGDGTGLFNVENVEIGPDEHVAHYTPTDRMLAVLRQCRSGEHLMTRA